MAALPPESLPCPRCRDGGGVRERCYLSDVLTTGVQVWAYTCDGCERWYLVRFHPQLPSRILVVDERKRKPRQTALAAARQWQMGL